MSAENMSAEQREKVRLRLEQLAAKNAGRLTPEAVVEDARRKSSPLHEHFTWDVEKAAHCHWIDQARTLIRSVRIEVITDTKTVTAVAYIRDPSAIDGEQGYVSLVSLKSDRERAREALVGEFGQVAAMLRRAREIAAALDAAKDVDELLEKTLGLRQRFMESPPQQQ